MNENEKRQTKAEIKEKLDKNSTNIKLNAGAAALLAAGGLSINAILHLCGFSDGGATVGSIIVYAAAAYGIFNYIRHVLRLLKEKKMLKEEMERIEASNDESKGMSL